MSTPAAMLAKRNSVRGMATLKGAAAIPADDQHKEDVDANARPGLMRTGSITSLNSINSITSISSTASAVTPNKPKSSDARRITIIAELIDTERNYLNYLNMIVNVFMNPLRASMRTSKPLIDPEQFKKLFSNLEAIIECNTPLFDALNNRWKNWNSRQCIGDTFLGVLKSLKAYTVYVNFFQLSKKTLETCETQSAFREFLKRVPRYVLLLQEVLKHTPQDHPDHVHLNEAIVTIREIVNEINEAKRKTEQQMELFELIQSIEDCPPTLLSANRQVLARVNVMRLATENEDYDANAAGSLVDTIGACLIDMTIVLFNDAVEVVKRRRAGFRQKTPYRHVNHADIRDIHIVDVADAPDVCHVYQATSSEEKQQFMAKLAKCQEANGVEEEVSCITNPLAEVAVGAGHKLKRSNTMMKTLGKVTGKILSRSSSMREEKPQSLSAASGRASASAATGSISSPRVKPARRSAMDVFPPAATTAAASTPSLLAPVAEATAPATPTTSVAPSTPKRSDSSVGTTTPSRAAPLSNPRLSSGLGTLKLKPTTPSSSTTKPPKEVMSTQHAERVEEPLSIEDDVFLQVQSLEMAIRQTAHKRAILHSGNNSLGTSPGSPRGRIASFPAPALSSNLDVSSVQDLLNNLQSIRSPSGDGKDSAMPRPSLGGNRRRTSFMPAPAAKVEPAKDEAALILDEADDDVPELEELNFDDSAMDALTAVQRSRRISSGAVNRQLHAMLLESKQATPADTPVKSAQTTPVKMGSGMARSPASAHSPSGHPRSSMGTPMSNERRSSSGVCKW
ncbi:hypothetical protein CAOG_07596 [Capsaspora owczarzaki ATCC 30864]|uniref:hypothetical protein n=1 Tax=Capsaspora owczarzaki (strain ATCC 30864) TaxID=595528 RepID=UPI00035243CA|nr:hypothetical protein CAOG_07596 [Capsaspora owczarzaki ATCC 30864]|eukprot:XP_004343470.2 hypothetical protein CAOG_07596 [Capsaspora owczarzaki ATCC 30864]